MLLQFKLLRHCLRTFTRRRVRSVDLCLPGPSPQTDAQETIWSQDSRVLFASMGWFSLLNITLLCDFKILCAAEVVLTCPLQGHRCQTLQLLIGWAEVKNAWSELTLAWVIWLTQRNTTRSSCGKKKVLGEEPGVLQQAFHRGFTAHGFSPHAVVCNVWNPECSIILFFLLQGGQAVPFLCQVFLLELDTCWKAAKQLVNSQCSPCGVGVGIWNQRVNTGPIVMLLMGTVVLSELGQNLLKETLCYKCAGCDTCLRASITLWQVK